MARELAPNLSEEDRRILAAMDEDAREAAQAPPPSARFAAKMHDQALTNAALGAPGPARDAHRRVMDMPREEFDAEFADVVNANAEDEDGEGSP